MKDLVSSINESLLMEKIDNIHVDPKDEKSVRNYLESISGHYEQPVEIKSIDDDGCVIKGDLFIDGTVVDKIKVPIKEVEGCVRVLCAEHDFDGSTLPQCAQGFEFSLCKSINMKDVKLVIKGTGSHGSYDGSIWLYRTPINRNWKGIVFDFTESKQGPNMNYISVTNLSRDFVSTVKIEAKHDVKIAVENGIKEDAKILDLINKNKNSFKNVVGFYGSYGPHGPHIVLKGNEFVFGEPEPIR